MSDDSKVRKRKVGKQVEEDDEASGDVDSSRTAPSLMPKADSAPENTLSAKTPHNYAFETKFIPSILSSNSTEQNFRGLFHLGSYGRF
jgi:hypothetical protein